MTRKSQPKTRLSVVLLGVIAALVVIVLFDKGGETFSMWLFCMGAFLFFVAVLFLLGLVVWLVSPQRRRLKQWEYRRMHMLCLCCGYNLRAHRTGGNCPECGTPVVVPKSDTFTEETKKL